MLDLVLALTLPESLPLSLFGPFWFVLADWSGRRLPVASLDPSTSAISSSFSAAESKVRCGVMTSWTVSKVDAPPLAPRSRAGVLAPGCSCAGSSDSLDAGG